MATNNKKKKAAAAVAAAALLLLGGTFAWQSISQTALNEASDVINPGGRLHDDFYIDNNGEYNSDIYVENFADDDIFARVRLEEYMEIVVNKGTAAETSVSVSGTKSLKDGAAADSENNPSGANLYDYTYELHYFDQENETDKYWNWTPGNVNSEQMYYMPTFNKNKDSLVADRNGMYVDRIGGISNRSQAQYEDWTVWDDGDSSPGTEIYDGDSNDYDEVGYDFENLFTYENQGSIITRAESHTAQPVGTSNGLISMSEWLEKYNSDEDTADYWVYDEDGWVYWSSAITAGGTTGRLLDEIALDGVMDDTWYYAINVVGQFITENDLGKGEGTGFYDTGVGPKPSDDALTLLETIGVDVSGEADDEDDPWEDPDEDGIITVDGQAADEDGYIYLYGLDIDANNSFEVLVSEDYELIENGLTAQFHESGIIGTTMVVDSNNPYAATLTIAARDYHSVTLTAEFVDGSSESVTVVPVYNTLVITPDMDGEEIILPAAYYSLRAEDFEGNVEFTVEGAKRASIYEDNGEEKLSISSYESREEFNLVATDGVDSATVTIVVKDANPYDGPIYTYYVNGGGSVWSYALMETQEYCWEQNEEYTYQVRAGMTNDYAGVIDWEIEGQTMENSVYFVDEDGDKIATYSGVEPQIKLTEEQKNPFTLRATIYEDQDRIAVMTDEEGNEYNSDSQYFTIVPIMKGKPVVRNLYVHHNEDSWDVELAPNESVEVFFDGRMLEDDMEGITNKDVTWSLVEAEPGCTFTIEEGNEESNTATITHTCDSEECTKVGGVQVKVAYDYSYGVEVVDDFYIVATGYQGNLELSTGDDEDYEDFDSGNLVLNYTEGVYDNNWDAEETVTFSIDGYDDLSLFDWEILEGGVYALEGQPGTFIHSAEGTDEWNDCPCTTIIKATLITDPDIWGAVRISCD